MRSLPKINKNCLIFVFGKMDLVKKRFIEMFIINFLVLFKAELFKFKLFLKLLLKLILKLFGLSCS